MILGILEEQLQPAVSAEYSKEDSIGKEVRCSTILLGRTISSRTSFQNVYEQLTLSSNFRASFDLSISNAK